MRRHGNITHRGHDLVAVILAIGVSTSVILFVTASAINSIRSNGTGLSENDTQVLSGVLAGMVGVLGGYLGGRAVGRRENQELVEKLIGEFALGGETTGEGESEEQVDPRPS